MDELQQISGGTKLFIASMVAEGDRSLLLSAVADQGVVGEDSPLRWGAKVKEQSKVDKEAN